MEIIVTREKMDRTLLESVNHLDIWESPIRRQSWQEVIRKSEETVTLSAKNRDVFEIPRKKAAFGAKSEKT